MAQYIDKDAVVAEIERLHEEHTSKEYLDEAALVLEDLEDFLDSLEVKEVDLVSAPTAYVVTRSEEHSDYVEEVFFDENKAHKYCDQFKGNENEYARQITKVNVTL